MVQQTDNIAKFGPVISLMLPRIIALQPLLAHVRFIAGVWLLQGFVMSCQQDTMTTAYFLIFWLWSVMLVVFYCVAALSSSVSY
jgi:hypothetical protein